MLHLAALVCTAVLAVPPALPADLEAFHEAEAKVGRDAGAHVKLALWCEAHGLQAERLKHLAIAVLTDPANTTARGLMGLVAYRGKWQRPDAVAEKVKSDEQLATALAEYNGRRAKTSGTAEAQWKLALWCEERGLKAEATAHLSAVVRFDPSRETAWRKLGYKRHDGRWMTDNQIAAEKAEVEAQKHANKYWQPLLEKWRGWLGQKLKHAEAEKALADVTDSRAVPSLWMTFATGNASQQTKAVQVLGQIDSPGSSRALAMMVVRTNSVDDRRVAIEILRRRDPREYLGFLIGMIVDPIRYQMHYYTEMKSKRWEVYRLLEIDEDKYIHLIDSTTPLYSVPYRTFADGMPFDPFSVNFMMTPPGSFGGPMFDPRVGQELEALAGHGHSHGGGHGGHHASAGLDPGTAMVQSAMAAARQRDFQIYQAMNAPPAIGPYFQRSVDALEETDAGIRQSNSQLFAALNDLTGEDLPEEREPWRKKWYDIQGYSYTPTPPKADKPKPVYYFAVVSCFGAGTMVQTLTGPRPIESIELGDRLLAQNTRTGGLDYRAVVGVHHNPPATILRVKLGNEVIVSSTFHRFWKAGHGWVMARELKTGDVIRTLGGPVPVESVEPGTVQPVFNLDIADDHTFLVGRDGVLVHDNTLPELRETPFDAPSAPGAVTARVKY